MEGFALFIKGVLSIGGIHLFLGLLLYLLLLELWEYFHNRGN